MNTNKLAWILVGSVAVIVIVVVVIVVLGKDKTRISSSVDAKTGEVCYYRSENAKNGLSDVAWIRIAFRGQDATGELRLFPAETDSKVGTFLGRVSTIDSATLSRTLDALWDTKAEGMTATEELRVVFGEGAAYVGFGEMVDRGNGVYGYKNKESITYGPSLSQVGCADLKERIAVEEYVRAHISEISPKKPVLGGTWYVAAISVDPLSNTGQVTYEDGHITEKSPFGYTYNGTSVAAVEFFDIK